MSGRRALVGLCMLCALAFSAIAAQAASAAGTTAYKCKVPAGGEEVVGSAFSDAHCTTESGGGSIRHVKIAANTPIAGTLTGTEAFILESVVGGLNTITEAKKVTASGTLENKETEGGERYTEFSAESMVFEEVEVTNRTCAFTGLPGGAGKLETLPVKASTKGQGMKLKIEPATGNKFAELELNGSECPAALKGKYPLFGTVLTNEPVGATTSITEATVTSEKTLRLKSTSGPVAGLRGPSQSQSPKSPRSQLQHKRGDPGSECIAGESANRPARSPGALKASRLSPGSCSARNTGRYCGRTRA